MSSYTVSISIEPAFEDKVATGSLVSLARRVLASENIGASAELNVAVTDDRTIRDLNHRFRGQDTPTDVLSFGLGGEEEFVTPVESGRQLGEVVISFPTALRQAEESGRDVALELEHLLAHGILHLLGYDHEDDEEARAMRRREERLLGDVRH